MKLNNRPTTQFIIMLSGLMLIACQNDTLKQSCVQLSAQQAGIQIINIYREAITETTKLLENQADIDTIEVQFDGLLNSWKRALLGVGQQIMLMSDSDKKQIEKAIRQEHIYMQHNEQAKQQFAAFSQGIYQYHNTDPDFYQKLESINIITQFAFFDLLIKQNQGAEQKWGQWMVPYHCPKE